MPIFGSRLRAAIIVLLALSPLWALGLFHRVYWTPDEPREADIAWRMSVQNDRTLPQLADAEFLEKPPLSYWMSAGAIHVFGESPSAARLPNLLYAAVTALAIFILVASMAGALPAAIATLVVGTAFTAYQVSIWLAPDACLMAGSALALLGAYRGYVAPNGPSKLAWYSLMHAGAAIGFMAKSGPGWIVPGLALGALVVWERRFKELLRWQLWAGFGLQLLCIGAWIIDVLHRRDGSDALRVMFWHNLVGRFTDLHATGALDYASGHKNWPGKYFAELPYDLFPWMLLAAAALLRAWTKIRTATSDVTPWRFALTASLPFLVLLSASTTARSIYAAPALLGFGVLVGLWGNDLKVRFGRYDRWAIHGTRYAVALLAAILVIALAVAAVAYRDSRAAASIAALTAIAVVAVITLRKSISAQHQQRIYQSLAWTYAAFSLSLAIGGYALLPIIDQWQNLAAIASAVRNDTATSQLASLQPDETTIAMLDYGSGKKNMVLDAPNVDAKQLVQDWFYTHPSNGRILVQLPGHAPGEITRLFERVAKPPSEHRDIASTLENLRLARVIAHYELPQGRRYALLAPPENSFAPTSSELP